MSQRGRERQTSKAGAEIFSIFILHCSGDLLQQVRLTYNIIDNKLGQLSHILHGRQGNQPIRLYTI